MLNLVNRKEKRFIDEVTNVEELKQYNNVDETCLLPFACDPKKKISDGRI